jgi:hypothetical protein
MGPLSKKPPKYIKQLNIKSNHDHLLLNRLISKSNFVNFLSTFTSEIYKKF